MQFYRIQEKGVVYIQIKYIENILNIQIFDDLLLMLYKKMILFFLKIQIFYIMNDINVYLNVYFLYGFYLYLYNSIKYIIFLSSIIKCWFMMKNEFDFVNN